MAANPRNDGLEIELIKRLDVLIALVMLQNEKLEKLEERMKFIRSFNLSNEAIAMILGTTKRTVEVIKSRIKSED